MYSHIHCKIHPLPSAIMAVAALVCTATATAHESSIRPALVHQNGWLTHPSIDNSASELAHYPLLLALSRGHYNIYTNMPGTGTVWNRIHTYNPDAQILLYQAGPISRDDTANELHPSWLNTISRWNNAHGHPSGTLSANPSLIMTQTVGGVTDRISISDDPKYTLKSYWNVFGSTSFHDYWADATINDMYRKIHAWSDPLDTAATNSVRPWSADGLFIDVASAVPDNQVINNNSYTAPGSWQTAMASFTAAATEKIRAYDPDQLMYFNVTFSNTSTGKDYWETLDQLPANSRPDGALEEAAFATGWNPNYDTYFYTEPAWRSQVDTLAATQNMNAIVESHTKTAPGSTGTDSSGNPTSFWDVVWFSMSSYLLGKNDANSYFSIWRDTDFSYLDEYDLDIGKPVAAYQKDPLKSVFLREYEKAWVLVNPSAFSYASHALPEAGKVLDHDNFLSPADLANTTTATLAPHRGIVVLKDPVIGKWSLDETSGSSAADSHEFLPGNSLGGTAYGSPTWLPGAGMVDGAIQFDGVNDYVAVAHDTVQFVTPETLSISYWVKPDSGTTGSNKATVMQFGTWLQSGWQLWSGAGWREFQLTVFDGTPTPQAFSKPYQAPLPSNAWTHLAVTVENKAGGNVDMYINGQPFHHDTLATPFVSTSSDVLYLGAHAGGTGSATYWGGKLDEVKIQRTIMSPYEVAAEYRALVADWRLDEPKYRRKAFDSRGSMHGTVNGAPTWLGSGGSGTPAGAIEFDGVDDEIIANNNTAQMGTSRQFTINAWIKPDAVPANNGAIEYVAPDGSIWLLFASPEENGIALLMYDGTDADFFQASAPTPLVLSTTAWNKVTISVDNKNGGLMKLYVNDVAVPIESGTRATNALDRRYTLPAGGTIRMGNTYYGYWKGKIGHVQLFDRILTQAEITQLTD